MIRIAVLVSGGGTNLQALINERNNNEAGELALVVSSKENAYAIERANQAGIPSVVVARKNYASQDEYDEALCNVLHENKIDLVVLAGFLSILGKKVIDAYPDRIVNIHPSLIPSFCGKGFYGLKIHEAALEKGVKVTGATVHLVNEIPDGGKILAQKAVYVRKDDTPEILQKRVMEEAEWVLLPQVVKELCEQMRKEKDS